MRRRSDKQKRWAKQAALQSGFHLPSQRESDFYWPTNVASRSRTEVNQYKWLGLSSLPFKIHELLGKKATAERDPCWKRFWSLFSANRHPWMLSDGWQCPGCIIFKDYNGLVSPHKERKCQCGDIVPLFNTVEIKSLCWIYPLIYAYPSEKTEKDTRAQGEEGDGFVTFGFLLFADGPCQSHCMLEIRYLKNGTCGRARFNPGNVKDRDTPQRPKGTKVGKDPWRCAWSRHHGQLLNASVSQSALIWLQPFRCRTVDPPNSIVLVSGTSLYFYHGEDFHSCNVLPSPLP